MAEPMAGHLGLPAAGAKRLTRQPDLLYHLCMKKIVVSAAPHYILLDSGQGRKLENFCGYIVDRPDPKAAWSRTLAEALWEKADAFYHPERGWLIKNAPPQPWLFRHGRLSFLLKLAPYKHTGIFPEQKANWLWLENNLLKMGPGCKVLNLFAYTGAATLVCARAGAAVCHVDASRPAINWARENQRLSGLENSAIRWIWDDCKKFVAREVKRGSQYHGIIMDPPDFGRGPGGRIFKLKKELPHLLEACRRILAPNPNFLLINCYNTGLRPEEIFQMAASLLPWQESEYGELHLKQRQSRRTLPCGIYVRCRSQTQAQ